MKTLKYIAMAVCCLTLTTACEDFLDVNTTKDDPTYVTVDQALPVATFYAAQICYDHAEYGVYMSQALTTASKSSTGSYPYSQGWEFLGVNRHPQWRRHFYDLGANIDKMIQVARDNNSLNYELIGRTIMLQSTMLTTDIFGDMPRAEAYKATSPRYDSQAQVYEWMFQEADELVRLYAEYNKPGSEASRNALPIGERTDRIYAGDMHKWAAYAKALRCRLYVRYLPNWDLSKASKIVTMVDEVLNDANWEEPRYIYPGGKSEQNCPWGPYAPIINSWESRGNRLVSSIPTKFFAYAILGCYQEQYFDDRGHALDPRATKIMGVSDKNKTKPMDCLESNIGMDVSKKTTDYPDLFAGSMTNPFTKNDGYISLITQEELMFIKAEAQYWAGDKTGAYNTTCDAVKFNMDRYGVTHYTITSDNSALKTDPERAYNCFWRVKLPGAAQFTIADLMQQKYVAMYLQPEQWTDLRRYNYSSKENDLRYDGVFVYTVAKCHDPKALNLMEDLELFEKDFKEDCAYSLDRPYNLYAAYWYQSDCYTDGSEAVLSAKAWVNRLNPDTETETKYNKDELIRIHACNSAGQVDYHWMQRPMIWQVIQGWNDLKTLGFE